MQASRTVKVRLTVIVFSVGFDGLVVMSERRSRSTHSARVSRPFSLSLLLSPLLFHPTLQPILAT